MMVYPLTKEDGVGEYSDSVERLNEELRIFWLVDDHSQDEHW